MELALQIKQLHNAFEKYANEQLNGTGLTVSQINMLGYLYAKGEATPLKEIESYFGVSQPAALGIVKRLQGKALITLETDPADKRVKRAFLTDAGNNCCTEIEKYQKELNRKLCSNISDNEVMELQRLLNLLYANIT